MEFEQFCNLLPKIELHAHLNGSLDASSLQLLGCTNAEISEYRQLTNLQATEKTLNECFKLFKVAHNATKNPQSIYLATKYVIEDFYKDNVVYLELRTTPRDEEHMTKIEYIEAVIKAIHECTENILVKLLLSIDRSKDLESSEETMELIIKMKEKYPSIIKGVDFSGNPYVGSFSSKLFQKARDCGLFVTLHCAEIKNDKEVKQILKFKPDRIGHGTFLHRNFGGSEEIWKQYLETNVLLECCLTSNVACGTAKNYKEHHLQEWIKNSLPYILCGKLKEFRVVIGGCHGKVLKFAILVVSQLEISPFIKTDDKGVFGTTLSKELNLANQHFGLTKSDLYEMTVKSINYTFASDKEKEDLRQILKEWKLKNHF